MSWLATIALVTFEPGLAAPPQEPAFVVRNPSGVSRSELVRASIPLPRGAYKDLRWVEVDGQGAPAMGLAWWPDGSLAVVQIQPRVALAPGASRRCRVDLAPAGGPPAAPAAPAANTDAPWFLQDDLPLHTELVDPWGTEFRARLVADPRAGPGGLVCATARVRVRRYSSVHAAPVRETSGVRRFFGLTGYLTTFVGERRAELTLLLENRGGDAEPVIGPARFRSFAVVIEDEDLRSRPRFAGENGLRPPQRIDGGWRQPLLGPSDQLYLGDGTAKAWRFDLFADGAGVSDDERTAARLAVEQPLRPIPDLAWTRHTQAFGAHGGPAPGPSTETVEALWALHRWRVDADRGPFGGFGDHRDAAANGTPRNGPSALHNVIRFASAELLHAAEGMVLQHTLRPAPGHLARLPAATTALRQGLSKRTMQRPHGFTAVDYEHFSVDLLYDYYWLTGDALARDEIARTGDGLAALLGELPFRTCRGEGWCMQAAVLVARATGDAGPVKVIHERFVKVVEPSMGEDGARYVIRQPPHPDALDGKSPFDCPWQMAAFVHGAHAMFRQTGDPRYAAAAVRTGRVMAGVGWLDGAGPKYFVSADLPDRYAMAVGIGPLEGTALMLVGGFVLAGEMATEVVDQQLFEGRANAIFDPYAKAEITRASMNPWFQLLLDRRDRSR